ncbi:MAG TPA: MFS transporter [Bellilinea sp.]|nr:MFS transporter [Bellilinea sp.]
MADKNTLLLSKNIPEQYRANFYWLYSDISSFGILNSSSVAFLAVYATHIGASTAQVGWINAAPAVISILFSLPFGAWMEAMSKQKAIRITAILMRLYFLPLIIIPLTLPQAWQIPLLIIIVFLMNIPGTGLAVSFNALFAESVPIEWRGYVTGVRNSFFAIVSIITSVICGEILNRISFPLGYVFVFLIGFVGAAVSTLSLWFVKPQDLIEQTAKQNHKVSAESEQSVTGSPLLVYFQRYRSKLHTEALTGPFRKVLLLMFIFSLGQYLPLPLSPIYTVNVLHISDGVISLGNAIFYIALFLVSTQLVRIVNRFGNQGVTGLGLVLMAGYPFVLALSSNNLIFLLASVFGGSGWSLASGAMYNYVLEKADPAARSGYLGWYNLAANVGVLIGSLAGPLIGSMIGLQTALFVFTFVRVIFGLILLRWG